MSEPSEVNDARRLELISAAQRQWVDALTDLGGRNTLLYYKDRRAGTLDLASADPDVLERFEKTGRARLTKLFTDADERADAIQPAQSHPWKDPHGRERFPPSRARDGATPIAQSPPIAQVDRAIDSRGRAALRRPAPT